jgi:D-lactate dehydrogenase (cytochrome)
LLDEEIIKVINDGNVGMTPWSLKNTLLYEITGISHTSVLEQLEVVKRLAIRHGAKAEDIVQLSDKEECLKLWRLRKECLWSAMAAYPDREPMITDVCVPLSQLPVMMQRSREILDSAPMKLPGPTVAHAGDGNSHILLFFKPDDKREVETAKRIGSQLAEMAISLGGTCTGML